MKILAIRPAPPGGRDIARLDVELENGVRLFELQVRQAHDGTHRVWAPHAFGRRAASLPIDITNQISSAAVAAIRSHCHDHRAAH